MIPPKRQAEPPSIGASRERRRRVDPVLAFIAIAAAIGLSQWPGFVPRIPTDGVAVFWAANALTAAAFLVFGPTRLSGVLFVTAAHLAGAVGCFVLENDFPPPSGFAYVAIDILEPYLLALTTALFGDRDRRVTTPRTVAVFAASAVLIPAFSGLFPVFYDDTLGPDFFDDVVGPIGVWSGWWLGNATGYAVIMPAAVLFMIGRRTSPAFRDWLAPSLLAAATTVLILGAHRLAEHFGMPLAEFAFHRSGVIFIMTPIFAFAAFRHGVLGAALVLPAAYLPSIFILADPAHAGDVGDLSAAVDLQIGTLETAFTVLLLAAFVEKLRLSGDKLDLRAKQLASAQRDAEEASRAKTKFLMAMSHEMRTPLHQIIMATDILRREVRSGGRAFLDDTRRAAERLLSVMDDVLDFARSSDALEGEPKETILLEALLEGVADGLRSRARAKGLTLRIEAETGVAVTIEFGRVRKALSHLLDNALRFTEEGEVILRALMRPPLAKNAERRLRLEVADTGPGVPASERERIFEPFTQVSEGEAREHQGLGVGLAVARAMVRLVGGEVGVEPGLPKGSVFWIEIPVAEDPRAPID